MSWHEALPIEVAVTFHLLAGGNLYDRLVEAMFDTRELRRHERREEFRDAYSRAPERRALLAKGKAAKERSRERVVAVRCCVICRKMYELTAWDRANGRKCRQRTCSAQCGLLASGRHNLHTLDGRTMSLRGWCLEYGVAEQTVRYRMKRLWMSLRDALTAPATPRSERRWKPGIMRNDAPRGTVRAPSTRALGGEG